MLSLRRTMILSLRLINGLDIWQYEQANDNIVAKKENPVVAGLSFYI